MLGMSPQESAAPRPTMNRCFQRRMIMSNRNTRHIVPAGPKKWVVTNPGEGAVSTHRTQNAAERAAKQDLRRSGGGEAIIHDRGGKIRDSDTIAPATDPNPPRDTRH